jgi:thiamine biosynthesis lipoprotein
MLPPPRPSAIAPGIALPPASMQSSLADAREGVKRTPFLSPPLRDERGGGLGWGQVMQANSSIQLHREPAFFRGTFTAMANPCEVLCETSDESVARAMCETAAHEAWRVERKFSRYRDDSIIHVINTANGKSVRVDDETAQLIDYAVTLWQLTQGAFDITSGVLRHAWRFNEPDKKPTAQQIDTLMQRVGWARVQWQRPQLTMPVGMELDFGGIGKEYAVDSAVMHLSRWSQVPALVNFGGDLRTSGPAPSQGAWQVGIESVLAQGRASNLIQLTTGALATSGDTRRFIDIDGRRYGHIIDARTGWPAPSAPRSVTVAADTCSQAGTFSTLAMLQGAGAETFLHNEGVRFWCLR